MSANNLIRNTIFLSRLAPGLILIGATSVLPGCPLPVRQHAVPQAWLERAGMQEALREGIDSAVLEKHCVKVKAGCGVSRPVIPRLTETAASSIRLYADAVAAGD